jgi:hypothetical protein
LQEINSRIETVEHFNRKQESWSQSFEYVFSRDKGYRAGHYRWGLFGVSDVFLVVVVDPSGTMQYEIKEYIIPSQGEIWLLDFCADARFERNSNTNFEFDFSILDNLPPTEITIPAEMTSPPFVFDTPGTHELVFDRGVVGTVRIVEVYALGAGGGGQGGHRVCIGAPVFGVCVGGWYNGTGGSGGGGAATYVKFSENTRLTFDITVGTGGAGGTGNETLNLIEPSGGNGVRGSNSTVTWGNFTLTALGGTAGSGDRARGVGGAANTLWPIVHLNNSAAAGRNGNNGDRNDNIESLGGDAGIITVGTLTSFGGGQGALKPRGDNTASRQASIGGGGASATGNRAGSRGGDGRVVIVITYYE